MATDTERLVVLLEARVAQFEKNLAKANATASKQFTAMERRTKQSGDRMEKTLAASTSRMTSLMKNFGAGLAGGVVAGLSVAGLNQIIGQIGKVAEGVANIGSAAKRAGVDVRSFQELSFVADQNRISVDALTDGLKELNLRADEFISTGKGSGVEAFQRLGLSASQLRAKLRRPSDLLVEIIGRLQQLDRAAQIRISDEIFGGSAGERMVELIDQGATGLRRQIEEARSLGLVLDADVIARADEIDRKFKMIASTVATQMKSAVVELAGAMMEWWDSLNTIEEQQSRTLGSQLATIGKRRLDIENQILQLKREQADAIPGNPFGVDHAQTIADLEAESAELAETETRILKALGRRYEETADTARDTVPPVKDLNKAVTGTGSAMSGAASGITSYIDAIRALKGEIPELADQLANLDARAKIDQIYRQALNTSRTVGQTIEATRLRDEALGALASKDAPEAPDKGFLDLIGHAEGTDKGRGYNESLAYGAFTGGPRNLVGMTLDEIDQLQGQMLRHPDNKFNSSALGRYQIVRKTLRGLRKNLGLDGSEYFDANMQDQLAQELMRQRGNDPAGLRNEWEGLSKIDDSTISRAYNGTSIAMPAVDPNRAANDQFARDQAAKYAEIIAGSNQYTQAMNMERQALDLTATQAQALRFEQDMLNQATQAGINLTPQQRTEIQQLAAGMANAEAATVAYAQSQQQAAEMSRFFGQQAVDALSGILTGSMTVEDALRQMLNTLIKMLLQAALLGDGPFGGMFGGGGGIFGMIGKLFGLKDGGMVDAAKHSPIMLASGGYVSGPGGPRDDKIPALLSDGEYVVNAAATKKHAALLQTINSGQLPAFRDGGLVGSTSTPLLGSSSGGNAAPINVTNNVKVEGSAGTPEQNADLSRQMAKQLEKTMRGIVSDEMRRASRPGNFANTRSR